MSRPSQASTEFSLAEARRLVSDLFQPKPHVFWADFLLSMLGGMICFALVRRVPHPALAVAAFAGSCALYYRATLFIHEIVHFRAGEMPRFRFVWNLFCGIPFLMPSFMYYTHLDHHRRKHYGTEHDGEYLALGTQAPWRILYYLSQSFVIPLIAVTRFLLVTPLCWMSPTIRAWVHQHASSMVMDPSYVRPLPSAEAKRIWRYQETATFLLCLGAAILLIRGRMPVAALVQMYCTSVTIIFVNSVRTLVAHRFLNDGHHEMTFNEQLADSINYTHKPWLTAIWAPVGLRYHALHHLFPSLPYHNLAEAHRRLSSELPANSLYHQTTGVGLRHSLVQLWRAARNSQLAQHAARPILAEPELETAVVPAPHAVRSREMINS
jgi:fatty acid desaturase